MRVLSDSESFASTPLAKEARKGRGQKGKKNKKKSKHDPRREDPTEVSEEAFVKARQKMPMSFWAALFVLLGERFEAQHGESVRFKGFRLLAMDGTVLNLPHYKELAKYFGTAKNGTKVKVPQARMVLLQFPSVRLPYRYELVPLKQAECTVAERLVAHLRPDDLLLMDRGFWSYFVFCAIVARGAHFGIRLRKGMKLRTVRRLGKGERIVRWEVPKKHRARQKAEGIPEAIELRVIDYKISGFRTSAVVTSVTDPGCISREDWVRLTTDTEAGSRLGPGLYHRRWEIETTFFELKVTQGLKESLRSHCPEGIAYEVAGHVLLYFLVRWLIVEAAKAHGIQDPLRVSFSSALEELQAMWDSLITSSPSWVSRTLLPRLLKRIAEHLVPPRPGRHNPRPNDRKAKNKGHGRYQLPSKLQRGKRGKG